MINIHFFLSHYLLCKECFNKNAKALKKTPRNYKTIKNLIKSEQIKFFKKNSHP